MPVNIPFSIMRKSVIIKLLFALSLCGPVQLSAHVYLDYPQGGESFVAGQIITVEWTNVIPHNTLNWDLFFSPDDGNTWNIIQMDIPFEQLSFQWHVPYLATEDGRIRVVQDNKGQDYQDTSMPFTILVLPGGPEITVQAQDLFLECSADQTDLIQEWLDNNGGAEAEGSCGDQIWIYDFTGLSDDCSATGTAMVTFTVTDDCGGNATTALLTVVDHTLPVIVIAATDRLVECDGSGNMTELNAWLTSRGGALASDMCGDVTWTNNFIGLSDGCGSTGTAFVTFTATDACGNQISTAAQFTVMDTQAPSIIMSAQDTVIDCTGQNPAPGILNWLSVYGHALAGDPCGDVTWMHDLSLIPDSCESPYNQQVNFTITDQCGNLSSTQAFLTLTSTVSISEPDPAVFDVRIFPNPTTWILNLEFFKDEHVMLVMSITDAFGQQLWHYQGEEAQLTLPMSRFMPGLYFLQIQGSGVLTTRKIIVE
jgi:hypothetical protein